MRTARQVWRERLTAGERLVGTVGGWVTLVLFIYWMFTSAF